MQILCIETLNMERFLPQQTDEKIPSVNQILTTVLLGVSFFDGKKQLA